MATGSWCARRRPSAEMPQSPPPPLPRPRAWGASAVTVTFALIPETHLPLSLFVSQEGRQREPEGISRGNVSCFAQLCSISASLTQKMNNEQYLVENWIFRVSFFFFWVPIMEVLP